MKLHAIATDAAPAALGPYSQAIRCGGTLYVSGQLPIIPATGKLIDGGIREQTFQLFENIRAIVKAAGGSFRDITKVTVFIADWND
jgi:2-iminobutanoate/2-iminopropanoate deaminase